jgi:hypothetical protein
VKSGILVRQVIEPKEALDINRKRRLNVEVDEYLYGQIRRYCVSQDLSISDITRKMWISYLQQVLEK